MAVANGFGKVVTSGSVFMYDTGDTINSYIGEPTVNLLYSVGATNLINGGGDIYGRCTKTDLGGGKYRFVNNGTGVSTIRLYTNQSDLINGATYGCSVYFENLILGLSIDWCDTGITGINYSTSPSGRLQGYGSRGSYASPYYFLDINLDSGGAVTLYNPQVERKDHVTPFVAGTRSATQGLLPIVGNSSIDLSSVSFDSNAQMIFDGTDDKIDIAYYSPVNNSMSRSWEVVIKPTTTMTYAGIFGNKLGYGCSYYCNGGIYLWDGNWVFNWYDNSSYQFLYSYSPPSVNSYTHIVGTYDATDQKPRIYVNGELKATYGSATNMNYGGETYVIDIGWNSKDGGQHYFQGQIPITKYYQGKSLSAAEVKQNYNKYKTRFNLP